MKASRKAKTIFLPNRGHFYLRQVRAIKDNVPLVQQLTLTMNSVTATKTNPEIWKRMNQIPASGLNKGTLKAPTQ